MSIIKAIEGQSAETQDKSCQITFTSRACSSTQVCWPCCCRVGSTLGYTVPVQPSFRLLTLPLCLSDRWSNRSLYSVHSQLCRSRL